MLGNTGKTYRSETIITICFRDPQISFLFSELIEAEGYKTQIVDDVQEMDSETHVITESSLIDLLNSKNPEKCLIVSDYQNRIPSKAVPLVRPLSEDKINTALEKFLPAR